jgi:hypothetical protein
MQTVTETGAMMDETIHPIARLSWRAILAGAIASLSITWLLLSLGGAVGLTAMQPTRPFALNPANAAGVGIWMVVAVGIGSFLGGLISVRASSIHERADAVIQGLTTWAFGFLFSAVLAAFLATIGGAGALSAELGARAPRAGGPAAAQQERAAGVAVDAGAGASWVVFASGLVGAIAGMAGGTTGLRRYGPERHHGRGVPLHRPTESPAT